MELLDTPDINNSEFTSFLEINEGAFWKIKSKSSRLVRLSSARK